ncbi:MAG: hypothetical protein ACK4SF_19730 [Algoriphagus aquaeductus]|uniref:hypothetical protein n=1 Tax=Algoriphagus aquaeductus TaxID=475299 RepID=UPI00391D96C1
MTPKKKSCIVSGHYPSGILFADLTKNVLIEYAKKHDYQLYNDSETEVPKKVSELHFRRCVLLKKAYEKFPDAEWYLWLDTEIYIQAMNRRIEEFIDLSNPEILYHTFSEIPYKFPVNTGVKFVHNSVIHWEDEIYAQRENCPFPYEQKIVIDYIVPKYKKQVIIHDPFLLNCLYGTHDHEKALFVHVCGRSEVNRNLIILRNTRKLLKTHAPHLLDGESYQNFYSLYFKNYFLKIQQALGRLFKK